MGIAPASAQAAIGMQAPNRKRFSGLQDIVPTSSRGNHYNVTLIFPHSEVSNWYFAHLTVVEPRHAIGKLAALSARA
jgi:hypothetical protein